MTGALRQHRAHDRRMTTDRKWLECLDKYVFKSGHQAALGWCPISPPRPCFSVLCASLQSLGNKNPNPISVTTLYALAKHRNYVGLEKEEEALSTAAAAFVITTGGYYPIRSHHHNRWLLLNGTVWSRADDANKWPSHPRVQRAIRWTNLLS